MKSWAVLSLLVLGACGGNEDVPVEMCTRLSIPGTLEVTSAVREIADDKVSMNVRFSPNDRETLKQIPWPIVRDNFVPIAALEYPIVCADANQVQEGFSTQAVLRQDASCVFWFDLPSLAGERCDTL